MKSTRTPNLRCIAEGIDPAPLRDFCDACARANFWSPVREGKGKDETVVGYSYLVLRWQQAMNPSYTGKTPLAYCLDTEEHSQLREIVDHPEVKPTVAPAVSMLNRLARTLSLREVAGIKFAKLAPGGYLSPHVDAGLYPRYFARFHFVVRSAAGSIAKVGSDKAHMKEGELWYFNTCEWHQVRNGSQCERIHLIIDGSTHLFCGLRGVPLLKGPIEAGNVTRQDSVVQMTAEEWLRRNQPGLLSSGGRDEH